MPHSPTSASGTVDMGTTKKSLGQYYAYYPSIAYSLPLKEYSPLYFVICSTVISTASAGLAELDRTEGRVDDLVHGHLF